MDQDIIRDKFKNLTEGTAMDKPEAFDTLEAVFKNDEEIIPTLMELQCFWLDHDIGDNITESQLNEMVQWIKQPERRKRLNLLMMDAFQNYDKDNNGVIDQQELKTILMDRNAASGSDLDIGDEEFIETTFATVDKDENGDLKIDALIKMMVATGFKTENY